MASSPTLSPDSQVAPSITLYVSSFFFLAILGFGTQGLSLARQVLYHLSHAPALFASVIFQIGSCVFACWSQTVILLSMPPA
jgi:hypothetical protein